MLEYVVVIDVPCDEAVMLPSDQLMDVVQCAVSNPY